jgi:hypothetical protein
MVRLVSLYLDYVTKGSVPLAISLLQTEEILSLSKGGSTLIKNLAALPKNTDFGYREHADEQLQTDYESLF